MYNNGRYFLGIGQKFISYPVNSIHVDFTDTNKITSWSKEGQLITLDIAFYYRLQRDKVYDIYMRYDQEYDSRIRQIAMESIKMSTINYECEDFFTYRTEIGNSMFQNLRAVLLQEWTDVVLFSLRAVDIPAAFEEKVVNKVVKQQEYYTALRKQETEVLRAEITVLRGEGNAKEETIQQQARADAALTTAAAEAKGRMMVTQQEADSYDQLKEAFSLDNDQLMNYRWAQVTGALEEVCEDVQFMMGFSGATLKVNAG